MSEFNTETTKYEKAKTTHGKQKNASYSVQSTPSGGCTPSALFVAPDREDSNPVGHRSRPKPLSTSFAKTRRVNETTGGCAYNKQAFLYLPAFSMRYCSAHPLQPRPFLFFPRKTTKGALSYPLTSFEMNSHYRLFRILLCLFFASALFHC